MTFWPFRILWVALSCVMDRVNHVCVCVVFCRSMMLSYKRNVHPTIDPFFWSKERCSVASSIIQIWKGRPAFERACNTGLKYPTGTVPVWLVIERVNRTSQRSKPESQRTFIFHVSHFRHRSSPSTKHDEFGRSFRRPFPLLFLWLFAIAATITTRTSLFLFF